VRRRPQHHQLVRVLFTQLQSIQTVIVGSHLFLLSSAFIMWFLLNREKVRRGCARHKKNEGGEHHFPIAGDGELPSSSRTSSSKAPTTKPTAHHGPTAAAAVLHDASRSIHVAVPGATEPPSLLGLHFCGRVPLPGCSSWKCSFPFAQSAALVR